MITLRVLLEPGVTALATDPFGAFWEGRVQAWRDSFQGLPFVMLDSPRISSLPSRAVVYVGAPDNVMPNQLDTLRRNWSTRTVWVAVKSVTIAGTVPSVEIDTDALKKNSASDLFGLGGALKQVGTTAIIVGVIALVIYGASKSRGTKSWR